MNKELKFTVAAGASTTFNYPVGISRLAITNYNGNDDIPGENIPTSKTIENAAIAHFTDAASAPLLDLVVDITAQQSGTGDPSPENVRPVSGFTVVNVGDINDIVKVDYFKGLIGGSYNFVNLGDLTWQLSTSSSQMAGHYRFNALLTDLKRSNTNRFLISSTLGLITETQARNGDVGLVYNAASDNVLRVESTDYSKAADFKTAMNGVYLIYEVETPTTPTITPTDFNTLISNFGLQGWLSQITTPAMPASDNTIYGAKYDMLSGKFVVTHGVVDLGSLNYYTGFNGFYTDSLHSTIKYGTDADNVPSILAPIYKTLSFNSFFNGQDDFVISVVQRNYSANYNGFVTIKDSRYTTPEDLKAALNGIMLVYELATPLEYNMGANEIYSLHGENNIFANTGNIEKVAFITGKYEPIIDVIEDKSPVFFDAVEDYSTSDISLVGATSTDIKNYLLANKNANIVIRVKRYSTILLYYLREYSPNYFAEFATHAAIFDAEGTKSMRIDYLRLDLTQETSDFTDDYIILPTS